MPTNPHYEAVRAKVIGVCPELMNLSFGCYLGYKENRGRLQDEHKKEGKFVSRKLGGEVNFVVWDDYYGQSCYPIDDTEIIGHPIHLSYVLRTIKKIGYFANIDVNGTLVIHKKTAKAISWDLEKDFLEEQDPSVWEAFDKMLSA